MYLVKIAKRSVSNAAFSNKFNILIRVAAFELGTRILAEEV